MSDHTIMAVGPRAIRRRRALGASAAVLGAAMTIAVSADLFATRPLLVAMDELAISDETQPVEIEPVADAPIIAPATIEAAPPDPSWRTFNGRPIRPARTIRMEVTAYSPDARSCGKHADGITASGYSVYTNGMKLAAADTRLLPFGSMISVPGYDGESVIPVLDRGGAIKGNRLDLLYPTHEEALQWGRQKLEVTIWEYADGKPNDFRPRYR